MNSFIIVHEPQSGTLKTWDQKQPRFGDEESPGWPQEKGGLHRGNRTLDQNEEISSDSEKGPKVFSGLIFRG